MRAPLGSPASRCCCRRSSPRSVYTPTLSVLEGLSSRIQKCSKDDASPLLTLIITLSKLSEEMLGNLPSIPIYPAWKSSHSSPTRRVNHAYLFGDTRSLHKNGLKRLKQHGVGSWQRTNDAHKISPPTQICPPPPRQPYPEFLFFASKI